MDKEQQFYNDMMHEFMQEEIIFHTSIKRWNDRIIKAVKSIKGESFYNDLMECINECEIGVDKFSIVKKPNHKSQKESWGEIKEAWVIQQGGYPIEDSFHGTVTINIKKGKYLMMPFST